MVNPLSLGKETTSSHSLPLPPSSKSWNETNGAHTHNWWETLVIACWGLLFQIISNALDKSHSSLKLATCPIVSKEDKIATYMANSSMAGFYTVGYNAVLPNYLMQLFEPLCSHLMVVIASLAKRPFTCTYCRVIWTILLAHWQWWTQVYGAWDP